MRQLKPPITEMCTRQAERRDCGPRRGDVGQPGRWRRRTRGDRGRRDARSRVRACGPNDEHRQGKAQAHRHILDLRNRPIAKVDSQMDTQDFGVASRR